MPAATLGQGPAPPELPSATAAPSLPFPEADEAVDAFTRWKRLLERGENAFDAGMSFHSQVGDLLDKRAARLSPEATTRLFDHLVEVDLQLIRDLRARGKFDLALAVQTRLEGWQRKYVGADSPETIEAHELAIDLAAIQRLPAKTQAALARAERLDAEVGPAMAEGDFERARQAAEKALAVRAELAEEHLDRAASHARLGLVLATEGSFDDAIAELSQALDVYRKRLGDDHPALADVMVGLADAYAQSKQWKEAEPLYKSAVEIVKKRAGDESLDYAQRLSQHAWGAWQAGELNLAAKLYNDATKRLREFLGEDSPELALTLLEFGDLRCEQESFEEALPLFEEAVELTRAAHGRESLDHAAAVYRVALCRDRLSDFAQSEALYREALSIIDGVEEPDPELHSVVLDNLGLLYGDMEEPEKAEPLHRRAYEIRKEHLGETHPDTLASQESLGLTLAQLDRFEEGEPLLLAVLEAHKKEPGPTSVEYATTLHLLGREYKERAQFEKATLQFKAVLNVWKEVKGPRSPEYASAAFELGEIKRLEGDSRGALPWHRTALEIRLEDSGPHHQQTLDSLSVVGKLLFQREQFGDAENMFHSALEAAEQLHGSDSSEAAGLFYSLGKLYRQWGEVGLAIVYLKESAQALDSASPERGREYAAVARELAGAYREFGAAVPARRWLGLAEEAAGSGVADDPMIAERAQVLVEKALFSLTFFPTQQPAASRPTSIPTPAITTVALLDKAATLAGKLEKPDLPLLASIALARARHAAQSSTPGAALDAARAAVEAARSAYGHDHSQFGEALTLVAQAHLKAQNDDEAEPLLLEATTIFVERLGEESLVYADAADQLAALWRRAKRIDDSVPLTLAACKARYRAAQTNLQHFSDVGLQLLYFSRCFDGKSPPSLGAANLLRPNDAALTEECARWAIAVANIRDELLHPQDEDQVAPATWSERCDAALALEREHAGRPAPDDAKRLDAWAAASPDLLMRTLDEEHPLHAASALAAIRKAVGPSGVVIEFEASSPLRYTQNEVNERRYVAWIIPGNPERAPKVVDLGKTSDYPLAVGAKPGRLESILAAIGPTGAEKVMAKIRAVAEAASAKTLYITSDCERLGEPLRWANFSTAQQLVVDVPNFARLVNDMPPGEPSLVELPPDGSPLPPRTNEREPELPPADQLPHSSAPTEGKVNAGSALPRTRDARDKQHRHATSFPPTWTNDGQPRPASAGN